jgi:hypothetical protein
MKHRSSSRVRRARPWIAIGSLGGLLVAVAAVLAGVQLTHGSSSALPPTPTIDARLIVHPHTVPVTGALAGAALHGTLSPGLPGANTVQLTIHGLAAIASSPSLTMVATMPGMPMAPVTARLRARHGAYSGVVVLPMFGAYTARLTLERGGALRHGTAQLSVPLTLGQ